MVKGTAVVLIAGLYVDAIMAGDYSFCALMNKNAEGGKIQDYSDQQIENGLCMTTKQLRASSRWRMSKKAQNYKIPHR